MIISATPPDNRILNAFGAYGRDARFSLRLHKEARAIRSMTLYKIRVMPE